MRHGTPQPPFVLPFARVGDPTPPTGFLQFWSAWHDRIWTIDPRLTPVDEKTLSHAGAKGVTHVVQSVDNVRVGCRVTLPEGGPPRGAVIELHGYGMVPSEPLRGAPGLVRRGLAHVNLRVRGYPGSQMDCGDLTGHAGGYVTIGMRDPNDWIIGRAVADVVCTFRAIRAAYGKDFPISIHGESFGGGLAIIAASAISARDSVHRLVIGVPTLGDWTWRLAHPELCGGAGEEVLFAMPQDSAQAGEAMRTLRTFDVLVHARRIGCPIVCKLAYSDPVVAPATTAAIYNALGSAPGWKWRFMTSYAHTDPASSPEVAADLRRHAMFEQLAEEFLDTREYPQTLMKRWEPELAGTRPAIAD